MTIARTIMAAVGVSCLMAIYVVAQTAPTDGRSIRAITQLRARSADGSSLLLGARIDPKKPTLIAFWASWCLPCMAEAPHLASLRRQFGERYNFLYINRQDGNPDPRQPRASIMQFLARAGITNADYIIADTTTYQRIVGADMAAIPVGVVGIPRLYLFDRHGRQVYTALGFSEIKTHELAQHLKEVITAQ